MVTKAKYAMRDAIRRETGRNGQRRPVNNASSIDDDEHRHEPPARNDDGTDDVESADELAGMRDRVDAVFDRRNVRPRDREIFRLHIFEKRAMADVGVDVGVSESRVSQIIKRLRRMVREALGRNGNGERAAAPTVEELRENERPRVDPEDPLFRRIRRFNERLGTHLDE